MCELWRTMETVTRWDFSKKSMSDLESMDLHKACFSLWTLYQAPPQNSKQKNCYFSIRISEVKREALQNLYCWFCMEGIHKFSHWIIIKQILHGLTSSPDYQKQTNIWNTQELLTLLHILAHHCYDSIRYIYCKARTENLTPQVASIA